MPKDYLNQEGGSTSGREEYLPFLAMKQCITKKEGARKRLALQSSIKPFALTKAPASHLRCPWSNPRTSEPHSLLLSGSHLIKTAFSVFDFSTISAGQVETLLTGKQLRGWKLWFSLANKYVGMHILNWIRAMGLVFPSAVYIDCWFGVEFWGSCAVS